MFRIDSVGSLAITALGLTLALGCKDKSGGAAGTESAVVTLPGDSSASAPKRDHRSVAEKVVTQSAGVKQGDLVLIFGSDEDLPLVEDIAVEVRKQGGSPLISVGSNRLSRRMFDEVPAKFDSQTPAMMMQLAGVVDVIINTEAAEGRTLQGVDPKRLAAQGKAFAPVANLMQKRGVRTVALGNGLYPSAERAEQFGISREELADMMYGGIGADYQALQSSGEQVRKLLAAGREVHITNPNGTDFKVGIAGRPITVNDGIISAEDRKKGGAATSVWLPAGEVYLTPAPGTGDGTVVADQFYFQGKPIEGLRLVFKGGKVTSMTAKAGLEPLQAAYDAAGPGKDLLGVIDIGINPGIKSPERSPMHVWGKAGTVTVSVGGNTWAGGNNQVSFGLPVYSPGSTLTVDGKPLVQDGKLVATEDVATR
ncbi:MAG: aminopeptidase [Gemmatimonadales bacterium]|nr:aminopeptidase [Gemmatimonadales bacterium]